MVKKAYMKTIEIFLVIILTMLFMIIMVPKEASTNNIGKSRYLINLQNNDNFREFVMDNNDCYNSSLKNSLIIEVDKYVPNEFTYIICTGPKTTALPRKEVIVDSLFFAGNLTELNFKTIRLYYWKN